MGTSNIQRLTTAPAECQLCGSRRAMWTRKTTDYGCGARAVLMSDDVGPDWRFTRLCQRAQRARAVGPASSATVAAMDPEQTPPAARVAIVGTMRGLRRLVAEMGGDVNVSIVAIAETLRIRSGAVRVH